MTSYFRGKKPTRVCLKLLSCLKRFSRRVKSAEQSKISKLAPNSHCVLQMMFIYKITKVKFCITLRTYHDVKTAANDTTAYTQCLRHHKKLILTAILLKLSQINIKVICIQNIQKKPQFLSKLR